jgi:hypothetical protein
MKQLVSPLMPFPNIYWWLQAVEAESVLFDVAEHFVKMSYRNRYYITGANGLIQLSVPLLQGRNQRTAMQYVQIDNKERWQVQHWRTIFSVYGRAPYYEYYAPSLEQIFHKNFDKLVAFNQATIDWAKEHTGIRFPGAATDVYRDEYETGYKDLRKSLRPGIEKTALPDGDGLYYQLFAERNGFYPNLSILDILFSEGPAAKTLIKERAATIRAWQD